jgi:hypothetical protein
MSAGLFGRTRGFLVFAGSTVVLAVINLSLGAEQSNVLGLRFGRVSAWTATVVVFAGLLGYVGLSLRGRFDAIFIDERNRVSLSRLQFALWTMLLFPAVMTAGFSNIALGIPDPLKIAIPPEVWALLGIGAFSLVAAPAVVDSRKKEASPDSSTMQNALTAAQMRDHLAAPLTAIGNVPAKQGQDDARWSDIVRGDTVAGFANLDISKVQQLAITIVLVLVYAASLYRLFEGLDNSNAKAIPGFPAVDAGFVALLGLSHASYLAYKKTSQ